MLYFLYICIPSTANTTRLPSKPNQSNILLTIVGHLMTSRWQILLLLTAAVACSARGQTLSIDLREALARARSYNPQFLASTTIAGLAQEDRVQAKGALLPSVSHESQ